jgi:dihydroorotate dehydrogenase (fumarate)
MVNYVASINTIGNALSVDEISEAPFISSNNGLAGLSGPAVKYTAMANVRQMRQQLKKEIDVVGVGGIESGNDVFLFLLCGASAVQVGTCHWKEGPKCFDRICNELEDILKEKGYSCVQDVIGQLKPWSKEGAVKSRQTRKAKGGDAVNAKKKNSFTIKDPQGAEVAKILNPIFLVIIAMLLADKFGYLNLPK